MLRRQALRRTSDADLLALDLHHHGHDGHNGRSGNGQNSYGAHGAKGGGAVGLAMPPLGFQVMRGWALPFMPGPAGVGVGAGTPAAMGGHPAPSVTIRHDEGFGDMGGVDASS